MGQPQNLTVTTTKFTVKSVKLIFYIVKQLGTPQYTSSLGRNDDLTCCASVFQLVDK